MKSIFSIFGLTLKVGILISLMGISLIAQAQSISSFKTPNVSANGLLLYRNSNFSKENTSTERNGLDIQEAEVAFYSDVDPYSRFSLLLAIRPKYELDSVTNEVTQNWAIEPEELFAELTQIPQTTVKLGKFKAAIGKHNLLHTHAFPFVDAPIVNSSLLGGDGLNDVGVSVAGLLPAGWFSELTLQYLRGAGENTEFNSPTPGDGVGVAHWKNLWDLSEALTLEAGVSFAQGANFLATTTQLAGMDLTLKWRPISGGKYQSWILGSELIDRKTGQPDIQDEKAQGANLWAQYQFAERWAALVRYESLKVEGADATVNSLALSNETMTKTSAGLVFGASEFSSYRIEYNIANGSANADGDTKEQKLYLQANFTIGAHPSHSY